MAVMEDATPAALVLAVLSGAVATALSGVSQPSPTAKLLLTRRTETAAFVPSRQPKTASSPHPGELPHSQQLGCLCQIVCSRGSALGTKRHCKTALELLDFGARKGPVARPGRQSFSKPSGTTAPQNVEPDKPTTKGGAR